MALKAPTSSQRIPLMRPHLGPAELDCIKAVFASGRLVQGPWVERFESEVLQVVGGGHAVAVSSGTSALVIALRALNIQPGDEVLCPDLSWPSPAHAVRLIGAVPVLLDVCPKTWNARAETYVTAKTPRTRAAIVIHQFGAPARIDAILSSLRDIPVIEDAACAIGSHYRGRACGTWGTIGCFSFHPRKVITTGEGGMCLTPHSELAARLRMLRNHGQAQPGDFQEAADNHRMSEVAAAIGCAQIKRLPEMIRERQKRATLYYNALPQLQWQSLPDEAIVNHQTLGARLPSGTYDAWVEAMAKEGIEVGRLSYALHRLKSVMDAGPNRASHDLSSNIVRPNRASHDLSSNIVRPNRASHDLDHIFAVSADLMDRGIALPLYEGMRDEDQEKVVEAARRTYNLMT